MRFALSWTGIEVDSPPDAAEDAIKPAASASLGTDFVSMANLFDGPILCGQLNRTAYEGAGSHILCDYTALQHIPLRGSTRSITPASQRYRELISTNAFTCSDL